MREKLTRAILKDSAINKILPLLLVAVLITLLHQVENASSHSGARFYRGEISVPTEWEGVIRVTGRVTVKEGVTLTVAPGTRVLVSSSEDMRIAVDGKFYVRGQKDMPVTFEPADGCGGGSPWEGIRFSKGSRGIIEGAVIKCSQKGIWGELAGVTIIEVITDNSE